MRCGQCKGFCREAAAASATLRRAILGVYVELCHAARAAHSAAATAAYAKHSVLPYQSMYVICMHNS